MSHSISLTCVCCGERPFEADVTSNLNPMLREAGIYLGDDQWKDKEGIVMLPTLQKALDTLTDEPERFRAMNPENGWGDYEGAVNTLTRLRNAIARVPTAIYRDWH